jgi:hypothetical protein
MPKKQNPRQLRAKDIDKSMLILQSTVDYMQQCSIKEQKVIEDLKWVKELLADALPVTDSKNSGKSSGT